MPRGYLKIDCGGPASHTHPCKCSVPGCLVRALWSHQHCSSDGSTPAPQPRKGTEQHQEGSSIPASGITFPLPLSVNGLPQPQPRKCFQDPSAHFAKWKQICSQAVGRAKNSCWSLGHTLWAVMGFEHPELSRRTTEVVLCWHLNPLLPRWKQAGFGGLEPSAGRGVPANCAVMGSITLIASESWEASPCPGEHHPAQPRVLGSITLSWGASPCPPQSPGEHHPALGSTTLPTSGVSVSSGLDP